MFETWSFTLRLNRAPSDDELDALHEAGLDDSAPEGELLHVDRVAPSLLEAAWSAARDVAKVPGLRAVRAVRDDAVTARDIAQRLGRSYESVRLLAEGKRGPGGFPSPWIDTSAGRVWSWQEVSSWFQAHYPSTSATAQTSATDVQLRAADALIQLAATYAEAEHPLRERIAAVLLEVA
ncbi:MAG TPA: hypothetical protein VE287_08110 [Actinopolymorphaceae bacterium]|nr:hypothetical protein [Actinopolymorphaceae bacterium]